MHAQQSVAAHPPVAPREPDLLRLTTAGSVACWEWASMAIGPSRVAKRRSAKALENSAGLHAPVSVNLSATVYEVMASLA